MSERTLQGIGISPDQPLPYTTLEPWVKKVGAITGFQQITRPYSLCYGAGTALDSSGTLLKTALVDNSITNCILGSVSDSLRNLIIHHADTRTFL
jgi:hypothetical protein